ncbi:ornithine cyclodeaminase family protein [Desulfopila sp. IMCC35008]|uniref:ornithine cyclodeaminase family protein n=1 Tax=Desulfopila sp. IMCC35008 TaxID=2653858 RepID=UPI0013D5A35A|nr:ornithine cyclodeaminase family protein [Desulfopila sp. IMCC35008]
MTQIFDLRQIKEVCERMSFIETIEDGFGAYSRGEVIVPPVGELTFTDPPGDTHIKYGYAREDDFYVIKIASGFYENPKHGLPSNSGLMLVFSKNTGELLSILLDEGYLTDVRTAVAGQIAAKYLAPAEVDGIGIFGTGIQAKMQVQYLKEITPCRDLIAWGRSENSRQQYKETMTGLGFNVTTTDDPAEVTAHCNLLVTATPSESPLIKMDMIRPGTHITAMGSDSPNKQELDEKILGQCDLVVADSISQCLERGEISKAIKAGIITSDTLTELGQIINGSAPGRTSEELITVADLTGVAVQDIKISDAVYRELITK